MPVHCPPACKAAPFTWRKGGNWSAIVDQVTTEMNQTAHRYIWMCTNLWIVLTASSILKIVANYWNNLISALQIWRFEAQTKLETFPTKCPEVRVEGCVTLLGMVLLVWWNYNILETTLERTTGSPMGSLHWDVESLKILFFSCGH